MENDINFQEWNSTRDLLDKFGDRIFELRKYGFSFITALLTAQAILIPNLGLVNDKVPNEVKFAVIGVTILLILTLSLFEKSYQILMDAADRRALIIEARLNLELLETVCHQSKHDKVYLYNLLVYAFFIAGSILLALAILPQIFYIWLIELAIFSYGALLAIHILKFLDPNKDRPGIDWTLGNVECYKGDEVEIICTNFDYRKPKNSDEKSDKNLKHDQCGKIDLQIPVSQIVHPKNKQQVPEVSNKDAKDNEKVFKAGQVVWVIKSLETPYYCERKAKYTITIPINDNHIWLWDTSNVEEGFYQLIPEGTFNPLIRKIRVLPKR